MTSLLLLLSLSLVHAGTEFNEMTESGKAFGEIRPLGKPSSFDQGPDGQIVGFYTNGKIIGAAAIPLEGLGLLKLFQPRNRHYASTDLISLLLWTAETISAGFPGGERMQIGDSSAENGGPISGHASHQNGLDVDIAYFRLDHREQDPQAVDGFQESFVKEGQVTENFDTIRNWETIKLVVSTGRVNRIFVDAAIKKAMCLHAESLGEAAEKTETLRRLRVWPQHDDHFHLRLTCPTRSPECVPQEEPPAGSGCESV
jgi:penicillin-insensitive murein DD-endopeptidase